jgi:hypothetical protein
MARHSVQPQEHLETGRALEIPYAAFKSED